MKGGVGEVVAKGRREKRKRGMETCREGGGPGRLGPATVRTSA